MRKTSEIKIQAVQHQIKFLKEGIDMRYIKILPFLFIVMFLLTGCKTAGSHAKSVQEANVADEKITVGIVQREINIGMSGSEVAQVLGSPNVITTDAERNEVWIYDKISSTNIYSESRSGALSALLIINEAAGASEITQRTLTVIIKFDNEKMVRDFTYHTSRF
jgi:outer membrane protein assembly factor BamE (lipoprotein component of BamABCDE complex)